MSYRVDGTKLNYIYRHLSKNKKNTAEYKTPHNKIIIKKKRIRIIK